MNYTTPYQSSKLLQLGVDPKTADLYYEKSSSSSLADNWLVHLGKPPAVLENLFSFRAGFTIPSWSTDALLEIIPASINYNGRVYYLHIIPFTDSNESFKWSVNYLDDLSDQSLVEGYGETLLEALFNLLDISDFDILNLS